MSRVRHSRNKVPSYVPSWTTTNDDDFTTDSESSESELEISESFALNVEAGKLKPSKSTPKLTVARAVIDLTKNAEEFRSEVSLSKNISEVIEIVEELAENVPQEIVPEIIEIKKVPSKRASTKSVNTTAVIISPGPQLVDDATQTGASVFFVSESTSMSEDKLIEKIGEKVASTKVPGVEKEQEKIPEEKVVKNKTPGKKSTSRKSEIPENKKVQLEKIPNGKLVAENAPPAKIAEEKLPKERFKEKVEQDAKNQNIKVTPEKLTKPEKVVPSPNERKSSRKSSADEDKEFVDKINHMPYVSIVSLKDANIARRGKAQAHIKVIQPSSRMPRPHEPKDDKQSSNNKPISKL